MSSRDILGFTLAPIVLIVAACTINTFALWSSLANATIPWFCTALALAMLVVGSTCTLLQCAPAKIPASRAAAVIVVVLIVLGAGLGVDAIAYERARDLITSAAEWVGFAVLLVVAFWLPRTRAIESPTQHASPADERHNVARIRERPHA